MQFVASVTYGIVTDESARDGDVAESGFDVEGEIMPFRDVVDLLSRCAETSTMPIRSADDATGTWASTEPTQDCRTGEYRTEHVHVKASGRNLLRLYRLAGLVS